MHDYQPFSVIGFHSCDKAVGLKVLNGKDVLEPSENSWDWLGAGVYFWEQNPLRAWEYALECSTREQFNKTGIETPFVLGAIIDLGNCLNLVESGSLALLRSGYEELAEVTAQAGGKLPSNKDANRKLDCAVIQHIHQANAREGKKPYDTVRCAFPEGVDVYPGAGIRSRLHIQVCVRNADCIRGYFLPQPLTKYNPHL